MGVRLGGDELRVAVFFFFNSFFSVGGLILWFLSHYRFSIHRYVMEVVVSVRYFEQRYIVNFDRIYILYD